MVRKIISNARCEFLACQQQAARPFPLIVVDLGAAAVKWMCGTAIASGIPQHGMHTVAKPYL